MPKSVRCPLRSRRLLATASLVYVMPPLTALAQESETTPIELDPLVIYGSRVATTLDETTASVGVVTDEDIETRELNELRDSFRLLGNVRDSDFVDAGFVIRGVNSEGLTPGGAPLASLYIDGIQQTTNAARRGARGLFDVEQVEVYRGPQSTLTGRAALAGAVYVKTKDPTYDFEAVSELSAGENDSLGGGLAFGGPLVDDQVAFRVAAEFERSENDINYPTFEDFDRFDEFIEDEYYQIRGKLLVEPKKSPNTRGLLTYSFAHDSPFIDDIGGPVLGFDFDDDRGDFNTPNFTESRSADNHNIGLDLQHDLSETTTLTFLATFNDNDTERPSINEGTEGETDVVIGDQQQRIHTYELRANYYGEVYDAVFGLYTAFEDQDAGFRRPDFFGFASDISENSLDTRNHAAFGEVKYEVFPTWFAIGGGRVDYTDQESSAFFERNGEATTDDEFSFDETVFLPKVGILKELTPDQTIAVTVQRGFRTGGAGVQRSTGDTFTFDPEFTWNYELSYKARLMNNRLSVAANIFYQDWEDQQVEIQEDPDDFTSTRIVNAAESTSYGFEVDAQYSVTQGLSIFGAIGFVDTEFDDFNDAGLGNLSGSEFPEAPKWNIAFGGDYQHTSGYFVAGDAEYTDDFRARFGQPPQEDLDSFFVANAQVGWRGDGVDVALYGENIFDERYFTFADNDIAATLGARREIGARVRIKF